jgi:RND family efflux transporter MFP subunit
MSRRSLGLAVVVVAALLGVVGFVVARGKPAPRAPAEVPVAEFLQEDLVIVSPQPLERVLSLTGSLAALTEALVKAKLAGELAEVAVREGDAVRRGQVVARIDATEVRARVAARTADVEAARAQLGLAEKNRATQRALLDRSFISQNAFDATASSYDVAAARLRAAEADLAMAHKALADTVLVSPLDGVVAERLAQPGERVAVDARILSVVDLSRLELAAAVPAAEIGRVKAGQRVTLRVDGLGEREFVGRVERINPAASAGTRSINIYAVFDNPDRLLRAGLFARGELLLERIDASLSVPLTAVRDEAGRRFVYALEDNAIARKHVRLGAVDTAGRVQVLEGLAAGDRVVRNNLGALREGAAARLAGPAPSAPGAGPAPSAPGAGRTPAAPIAATGK